MKRNNPKILKRVGHGSRKAKRVGNFIFQIIIAMKNQLFIFCLLVSLTIQAQNRVNTEGASSLAKATEFSIPTAPAFDLLGVNPSQVTKPSTIRDFKVDWSFKSWSMKPNIALEAQPIWELFYNKADLRRYQRASKLMQRLSTLDISAGTVIDDNGARRASMAAKLNLYKEKDPLSDAKLFECIDTSYRRQQLERMELINEAAFMYRRSKNDSLRCHFQSQKDSLEAEYDNDRVATEQKAHVQEISQKYMKDNWNSAHVDIAYGKVMTYDNPSWDSLRMQGFANAVWLNGSIGISNNVLITGMVRYTMQNKKDTVAGGDVSISKLTSSNVLTAGINMRYGSPKFNFFTEFIYSKGNTSAAITDAKVNLNQLGFYSISYGGDWRINRNIMLSFGVRTDYSEGFRFKNIIPVASIACMMR